MLTSDYRQLGKGSYGITYINSSKTLVIKKMKKKSYNLNEILLLKSLYNDYSSQFIPYISDVMVTEGNIYYMMNYCGMSLYQYSIRVNSSQRIKLIPSINSQFARILKWLKDHNIAHMDIKPENICIVVVDETYIHLKLIDFGFAGLISGHENCYHGTKEFADPNFLDDRSVISSAYDVFSCGLVIINFLFPNRYINPDMPYAPQLVSIFEKLKQLLSEDQIQIMRRMLDLNSETRITPEELYSIVVVKLPLENCRSIDAIVKDGAIDAIPEEIEEHIRQLCSSMQMEYLYSYTINMYTECVKRGESSVGNAIACLLISNWILHFKGEKIIKLDAETIAKLNITKLNIAKLNIAYSEKELFSFIIGVCTILDWKLYPTYLPREWRHVLPISIDEISCSTDMDTESDNIFFPITYISPPSTSPVSTNTSSIFNMLTNTPSIEKYFSIISTEEIEIRNAKGKKLLLTIHKKIVWNTFQSFPEFWDIFTVKNEKNKQIATREKYTEGFYYLQRMRSLCNEV